MKLRFFFVIEFEKVEKINKIVIYDMKLIEIVFIFGDYYKIDFFIVIIWGIV